MSFNPSQLSEQTLKRFVDRLVRFQRKQPHPESWPPKRHQCQEMIAAALGFQNWNEAISSIKRPPSNLDFYDHMRDGMIPAEPLSVVAQPTELIDELDFRDFKAFYEQDGLIVITGGSATARQLFMSQVIGFFNMRMNPETMLISAPNKNGMQEVEYCYVNTDHYATVDFLKDDTRLTVDKALDLHLDVLFFKDIQVDHSNKMAQFKKILEEAKNGLVIISIEEDIQRLSTENPELKTLIQSNLRLTVEVSDPTKFPQQIPFFKPSK